MKHFMITYKRETGSEDQWHDEVRKFIAALDGDPALTGKISYRSLKGPATFGYFHLATVTDDAAVKALQQRDYFKHYAEQTRRIAGGKVETTPLDLVAETASIK